MENDIPHGNNGSVQLLDEKKNFNHQKEEFVDDDVHHERNRGGHLIDEHNLSGQQNEQFMDSDTPNKSDGSSTPIDVNNSLRLVMPGETGEGLPYAPIDWPNPGDNWKWRVGRRVNSSGYFRIDSFTLLKAFMEKGRRCLLACLFLKVLFEPNSQVQMLTHSSHRLHGRYQQKCSLQKK